MVSPAVYICRENRENDHSQVTFHLLVDLIELSWVLDGQDTKYVFSKENQSIIIVLLFIWASTSYLV